MPVSQFPLHVPVCHYYFSVPDCQVRVCPHILYENAVCVCVRVHVCVCVHVCMYVCVCVCAYMHVCVRLCVCVCVCVGGCGCGYSLWELSAISCTTGIIYPQVQERKCSRLPLYRHQCWLSEHAVKMNKLCWLAQYEDCAQNCLWSFRWSGQCCCCSAVEKERYIRVTLILKRLHD